MAVDADLCGSTTTGAFGKAYPDRLVDVGIAEQNMIGVASGLALTGRTVFTGSFAVFGTGRCWEQIRNTVCDSDLDVKICPTHAGITVGPDGATHQALEDIALMRVLPGMRVLVPADYASACAAIRLAAATPGPFYVRLGREPLPEIYDDGFTCDSRALRCQRGARGRRHRDHGVRRRGGACPEGGRGARPRGYRRRGRRRHERKAARRGDHRRLRLKVRARSHGRGAQRLWRHGLRRGRAPRREVPGARDAHGHDRLWASREPAAELLAYYGLDAPAIARRVREVLAK